jgi:hypothetical protein
MAQTEDEGVLMPYDRPRSDTVPELVSDARARAREAARLIQRLDPWRNDPRVAIAADICTSIEGPSLFRFDTADVMEALAEDLRERLAAAEASGNRLQGRADILRLHTALMETAAAARRLGEIT